MPCKESQGGFFLGESHLAASLSGYSYSDFAIEKRKHCFVRYADGCNIYVGSRRAGERVKQSITGLIARRLKLRVNEAKSAVARPAERKFLGFSVPRLFTGP